MPNTIKILYKSTNCSNFATDLPLPVASCRFNKALYNEPRARKERFRNNKLHWEQIPRANDHTKPLQEKAVNLLAVIVHKLRKMEVITLNHNYLTRITKCKKDQNVNLLKQLSDILDISFHAKITIGNTIYRNCYVIKHTEHGRAIIENPEVLLTQKHFVGNIAQNQVKMPSQENEKDSSCAEFFRRSYIYKEELFKNNRSNVHTRESNFLKNSEEIKIKENREPRIVELPKESVKPAKLKTRPANERKKRTNAERKARIYRFNQYKEPQDLSYHYPLTKEDGDKLQSLSGRAFTLQAMNEILLAMSKRLDNRFCSKAQFMAYFGKCLRFEMRDSVKTGNDNFRIKTNITPINQKEIEKAKQVEQYLAEVERRAITYVCPNNQLKARLANTLESQKSYELLSNIKDFEVVGNTMRIYLRSQIQLNDNEKSIVLSQVKSIYSNSELDIESVEYLVENVCNFTNNHNNLQTKKAVDLPLLQQSAWGDVCRRLIKTYGIHIYNNWLSRLTPVIDEGAKTIELGTPNSFVKQWVETNYRDTIQEIVEKLGFNLKVV